MAKNKLNIGLIGKGFMGKAHSFAWSGVNRFFDTDFEPVLKVCAGTDIDSTRAFADTWGWEEATDDWNAIVERDDIDVVDIVSPTFTHDAIAIAAAESGKHVFCEKPAAVSYAKAKAMAEAANKAGVVHYLNHNYRRVPAVIMAKKLIDDGRIGEIFHWRGTYLQDWIIDPGFPLTWHFKKESAGGGPLYDLNSHSVDLARYLVGEIDAVTAVQKTFTSERPLPGEGAAAFSSGTGAAESKGAVTVDDASFMIAEFNNGSLGSFNASRMATGRKNWNDFEIYGSKGSLHWNFESMNELGFFDATKPAAEQGFTKISVTTGDHPYGNAWWAPGHIIGYENTFFHAVADFLKAVSEGGGLAPNLDDGASCIRVLEAAAKSSDEKRRVGIEEITA
ncbi:MAG: Gfo/Idh/MocA family oxidoreductase [Clostridiales Family XIII bacterium]|jgi:predicted dehydrogenase|nr:Gfo/Idh/MocA family oxidoreductase [Clostridiales Family XIII bacterium]